MSNVSLACIVAGVPICAVLFDGLLATQMAERHHSHHDTYAVSTTLSHTMVAMMIFMGVLGLMLSWLCALGVFVASPRVILAFFAAFLVVVFSIWLAMHHYQVVTFSDRMRVTPFVGASRTIIYSEITRMEWTGQSVFAGYRSLRVFFDGGRCHLIIWGSLDIDQILIRINRFDVLEGPAGF